MSEPEGNMPASSEEGLNTTAILAKIRAHQKLLLGIVVLVVLILGLSALILSKLNRRGYSAPSVSTEKGTSIPPAKYGSGDVLVNFTVKVPDWTPQEDNIYIYFDIDWLDPLGGFPMEKISPNTWTFSYRAKAEEDLPYKYNRNNFQYATDEEFTPDSPRTWRKVSVKELRDHQRSGQPLLVKDEVKKWRWLTGTPPPAEISSFTPEQLPLREQPFVLGMGMIDFHNDSFNPMIESTLDRIKEQGFEYVQLVYYPSSVFLAADDSPKARGGKVVPPKESFVLPGNSALKVYPAPVGSYSDAELDTFVRAARERGLKLMMTASLDIDPNSLGEIQTLFDQEQSDEWWEIGDKAWEEAMLRAARKAAEYQIEIFFPEIHSWGVPVGNQEAQHHRRLTQSFKKIRAAYPGILITFVNPYDYTGFPWYQYLDWMADKWAYPLAQRKETTLEEMVKAAQKIVQETYAPLYQAFKKPILLQQVLYHANDGAAGGLMIGSEGPEIAEWFPYNDRYPADFQEQADAYEAVFQAIYDQPFIAGAFSFSYTYWTLYDKSAGIRGKPAEKVWARWSRILSGQVPP